MKRRFADIRKHGDVRAFLTGAVMVVLALSLLPIFALAGVDRASADDWGCGILTHWAWVDTHSVFRVLQAAFVNVKNIYFSWQGTWFSVFLFSLQPEVFSHKAYWIVPYMMTLLFMAGVSCFLYNLLVRLLHISRRDFLLLDGILLLVLIQFVPHQTSAIFWYNGAAHYTIPFALAMAAGACFLRYVVSFRRRDIIMASVWMTLLGGTNYLAAFLGLMLFFLFIVLFYRKDHRIFRMLIPMALEMTGLIISALAPGNAVRGGDDYQVTLGKMLSTVWESFRQGAAGMWHSFGEYPVAMAAMIAIAVLLWDILRETVPESGFRFPCPGLVILYFFCVYCAMYWPVLFVSESISDGSTSVGVPNTIFWVFICMLFASLLYGLGWLAGRTSAPGKRLRFFVYAAGFTVSFLMIAVCRLDLKNSTDYVCYYYIHTGRAAVYKEQMDELTRLLTQEGEEDVVVPFIVGEQEPLVHLPITLDKDEWSNRKMAEFFRKKSLVAVPRDEWERQGEIR